MDAFGEAIQHEFDADGAKHVSVEVISLGAGVAIGVVLVAISLLLRQFHADLGGLPTTKKSNLESPHRGGVRSRAQLDNRCMAESNGEQAVIASFDSQAQAEQAAKDLMGWDKSNDDVKLGAIGVLTKDDKGEIKTHNYSQRKTGKGAKVGMGLGVIAAVFSGGLTLIPTAIGGATFRRCGRHPVPQGPGHVG